MSDSTQIGLAIDASGATRGADQFKTAGKSVIDTSREIESAQIRIVESAARQGRALDNLTKRLDPLSQAVRDAGRDLERLQRIASGTGENAERAAGLIAGAQAKLTAAQQAQSASTATLVTHTDALGKSATNTSHAMRQLGIQSIDVFQQLASGAPVMTTFIQQGGQIGQVMAVTNTSIGAVARSIGSFVAANAGIIATTAALAGMAGAAFLVFQRSADLDKQQRELSVAIAGVGRSADLSSTQLQGYVQRLKEQGVAVGDANKAVAELARNSGLSGGLIGRIVGLGPDAAAALGVSAPDAMAKMADAAKGSIDAIQKLSDAFNLLTPAEEAAVRAAIAAGDKVGALETVFGKLEGRVKGLNEQALSPMDKAFRDLGNSWDGFLTRVANSGPVLAVFQQLNRDIQAITGAVFGRSGEALSQEIVGLDRQLAQLRNDGAYDPSPQTTAARRAEISRIEARQAELIARARAESEAMRGSGIGAAAGGGVSSAALGVAPNTGIDLARQAAERAAGSDSGRLAALTTETNKFRDALKALDPSVAGNRELIKTYTGAIQANEKAIAELTKKGETHRSGLEKTQDTLGAQIQAQRALAEAYRQGPDAIARVLALQEAQKKVISDGLQPGTAKYAATVADLTKQYLELAQATGSAQIEKTIEETNRATEAQARINAAYDGTAQSVERATNAEKAREAAIKAGLQPGAIEYAQAVERLNLAYDRGSDLSREFQHAQRSVQAVTDMLGTAFDRLGQGIVDAFVSGRGAAVSFSNIARAVMSSLATDLARLAIVNPIRNAVFGGTPAATLGAATSAFGGGASGGGLLGGLGNVLSLGRITDALGLTNLGGSISNLLGFGEGGFLSGIGSSITGALNAPIFGASALSGATNSALAGLGSYGPATAGQVGIAGTTFGQLLGGIGLGFGAGSFGGGLLQSALGKTGPGPTIGAGVGAVGGTIIGSLLGGPVVGGLIGGLLGGGGGGLIGPGPANAYSATGLNLGGDGLLSVGQTFAQIADPTNEVNTLTQQVQQINSVLSQFGARISNASSRDEYGQQRIIGGRSGRWLNFGQGDGRPSDLSGAFGELRFGSDNPALQRLLSREFTGVEDLANSLAEATQFLNEMVPALKQLGSTETTFGIGTLNTAIQEINRQFDAASATADKLGWAEFSLTEARGKAIQAANDNIARQLDSFAQQLDVRRMSALGAASGDPRQQMDAALLAFDIDAREQRRQFSDQQKSIFGDAFQNSADYAMRMANLESTLGAERWAIAKGYLDQINSTERAASQAAEAASGTAGGVVRSITDYVRSISLSQDSALPASARYNAARSQFESAVTAARSGDATALTGLTGFAETFRSASRSMFGSGANFVGDFDRIVSQLGSIATMPAESLTAVFSTEVRSQTQTLVAALAELRDVMSQVRDETRRATSGPPAARAA